MRPRLVAISGPFEGQTFGIRSQIFVVGRQADCDLQVPNIEVSRRHCEIAHGDGDRFVVRDLGSRHGTMVNSRPVNGETALAHSDLLTIGTSALLFLLDDAGVVTDPESDTGSMPAPSLSLEHKLTETLHLDPARVDGALPAQARLARELHALLRLSTSLQEELEIGPLAARLLDAALEAIPAAARGAVLLREPGVATPSSAAERGLDAAEISQTVIRRVLDEGLAICSPETAVDPSIGAAKSLSGVGSLLAAPVVDSKGEALGLLYLDQPIQGFGEHHLELVAAMAGVASLAFQNALHLRWLERENRRLREADAGQHDMIGESDVMRRVFELVARVARTDSTVLIEGESGTGKELVARALHHTSPRRREPFVAVNCATLSDTMLESELFGHEKGAFTGALARKIGKMETAHRGTLFLDEVAEIPIGLQAKLLRALQEREIERVGGTRPIRVDLRVVAASHRDLAQAVKTGDFRDDLFFRLKVITCTLPPLRERREDVPLLARHFAHRHGEKLGFNEVGIAPEARRCLLAYDWPGNVRELGNVIERAVVLGDGEVIRREDLPDEVAAAAGEPAAATDAPAADFQSALVAFKKQLIGEAWQASGGDYAAAAEHLGIHVNSLHRMIRRLGIKDALGR